MTLVLEAPKLEKSRSSSASIDPQLRQRLNEVLEAQLKKTPCPTKMPLWLQRVLKSVQDNKFLKKIAKVLPWAGFGGMVALQFTINAPAAALGVCLFTGASMIFRQVCKRSATMQKMVKNIDQKMGQRKCLRVIVGLLFGSSLWMQQTNPVFAQFFQGAEDFFTATFPDAGEVVPVIFGVIRALFLIYIAVALVRVIQSARNDDDWQQMARAPVIIVMAVVLGDVLTNLVVGG